MHGPTFMGNPIACAAANASLDLFDQEPRLEQVAGIEEMMRDRLIVLNDDSNVDSINVRGAVGAVRMDQPIDVDSAVSFFVERGVWVRPIRDTVYLAPAFTVAENELSKLCDAIIAWVKDQRASLVV